MKANDSDLLRQYLQQNSEEAFAVLVSRHLNLVYSAALRQVRSPQLAEEVAQSAFTDLARNAARLKPDTIVAAWLYQVTRRTAIDFVRHEARRQLREQIATEMNAMNATTADWTHIEPLLDEAMSALDETDRAAVLLRYFENKSLGEVGATLGTSDDAAQKRVSRAVERLREFFAKHGITVGAVGLSAVISANAVQAAPVGLAATIATAAAFAGTAIATTATATKAIVMTTLQKALIAATVIAASLATSLVIEHRSLVKLRNEHAALKRLLTEQSAQLDSLRADNQRLAKLKIDADELERLRKEHSDLPRLRGKVALLQREIAARPQPQNASANWKVGTPRRLEEMRDVGLATPEAALQTTIWASINSPQRTADLHYLPTLNATNAEDVEWKRRAHVDFAQNLDWSAVPELTIERIDYHQQKRFEVQKDQNGNIIEPGGEFADLVEVYVKYPGYPGNAVPMKSVEEWENMHLPQIPTRWRFTRVGDQWLQVVLGASPDNPPKSTDNPSK